MRLSLFILFTIIAVKGIAASGNLKYYVTSAGSDGNAGTTQGSAWASISKVNAMMSSLTGGDTVFFHRGEIFFGSLIVTKSGISGKPIVFDAYGTGAKPILTTFVTLSGWTNTGNIYTSSALSTAPQSPANIVVLNGQIQTMGRWPNAPSNINQWTLKHEGITSSTITDNDWGSLTKPSGVTNWIGAEIVYRFNRWQVRHGIITNQPAGSSAVYTFTTKTFDGTTQGGTGEPGYAYFIQNDPNTLDQNGEWYYNPTTKKASIYLTGGTTGTTIQMPMYDKLVVGNSGISNITIRNLELNGANQYGVYFSGGAGINVIDCDVHNTVEGIRIAGTSTNAVIRRNNVYDCTSMGIAKKGGSGNLDSNYVHHIMWLMGMNENNNGNGQGIYSESSGTQSYNRIDSTAYNGLQYAVGDNIVVEGNLVNYATMWVDDGGGIYTVAIGRDNPKEYFKSRIIRNNIVKNSIGNAFGTGDGKPWGGYGFYGDNNARNYIVNNNTFYNCKHGIYLHFPQNVKVTNNLVYNDNSTGKSFIIDNSQPGYTADSLTITGNIFFSGTATGASPSAGLMVLLNNTNTTTIGTWGTINNNYFTKPLSTTATIIYATGFGGMTLATWKTKYGMDANSVLSPVFFPNSKTSSTDPAVIFKYVSNEAKANQVFSLGGMGYVDAKSNVYPNNNIAINGFEAAALMLSGSSATTTNINPTVSITFPSSNTSYTQPLTQTINASASDADGTVSKVEFYAGNTLLGSDLTSPYSYVWNSVPVGTFAITAKATDNAGGVTISSPVNITVVAANQAPTINITSPVNNAKFIAPSDIMISTDAADADGYLTSVKFYNGTTLLATITTQPFTFTWSSVPAGSYTLTAVATDNNGVSTTSGAVNISVRTLVAPNVSVTSPADNSNYISPASITLSATASDPDGAIQKVEFYNNGTLINTDVTAPYSYTLTNVTSGTYNIMAKAYDDDNLTSTSSVVTIVSAPVKTAPTSVIYSPVNGYATTDPASIGVGVTATDNDGTIQRVELYQNGNLIATDNSLPYVFIVSSVMAGSYSFTAKAIDNDSLSTTSTAINVTVTHVNTAPTLNIIEPSDSAVGQFKMTAVASDNDGTITKVEFFNGSTLLGTVTTLPYSLDITLPVGTYTLSAKATDNNGATTTKTVSYKVISPSPTDPIKVKGFKGVIK